MPIDPEPTAAARGEDRDPLPVSALAVIARALEEDLGTGDRTTETVIPPNAAMAGRVGAKQEGTVAGLDVARAAFRLVDDSVAVDVHVHEGTRVADGQVLATVTGPARSVLSVERVALNFLGRMSGIATLTRRFVNAVAGTPAVILDTRKTAPGLRFFDKLAVRRGGGQNHRMGLYDAILIKDNHIDETGSLTEAVRRAAAANTGLRIEVEARTLEDVRTALAVGVTHVLLDNMSVEEMREAVALAGGRAALEASGNVTLERVRAIAETGVTYNSVGALTHSAPVFNVNLKWTGRAPTA